MHLLLMTMSQLCFLTYKRIFLYMTILLLIQAGAFSRNAGHVLQATANTDVPGRGMAFQEYSPDFPHKQYTMGYAGKHAFPRYLGAFVDAPAVVLG
jgi:hypothetical protein